MLAILPSETWTNMWNPWLWALVFVSLLGVVSSNMRVISVSTLVTILIPEDERDKANGKVGTVSGLVFTVVSAFS